MAKNGQRMIGLDTPALASVTGRVLTAAAPQLAVWPAALMVPCGATMEAMNALYQMAYDQARAAARPSLYERAQFISLN